MLTHQSTLTRSPEELIKTISSEERLVLENHQRYTTMAGMGHKISKNEIDIIVDTVKQVFQAKYLSKILDFSGYF